MTLSLQSDIRLEEICHPIYLVHGENEGRFPFAHSIIIFTQNKKGVLIDTGCGIETLHELKRNFIIETIVNTHTHTDHCAGNWVFNNQAKKIYVPEEGRKTAGNLDALANRFAKPGQLIEYWRTLVEQKRRFKEFSPTHTFNEKRPFEFGDVRLEPVHTPGHSKDHYCFYEPSKKIMLSVDIDLTSFGPWYGDKESSVSEFKSSIKKMLEYDMAVIVSSHKGIIRNDIHNKIDGYYAKFDERDRKIKNLLKQTSNLKDLVEEAPIYGQFSGKNPLLHFWEEQMILKHLKDHTTPSLMT